MSKNKIAMEINDFPLKKLNMLKIGNIFYMNVRGRGRIEMTIIKQTECYITLRHCKEDEGKIKLLPGIMRKRKDIFLRNLATGLVL